MGQATRTAAAFDEMLAALAEIRDDYVLNPERHRDETETLEGFQYAVQLVGHVSEFIIQADIDRPRFSLIVTPARKFLGDNPDSIYHHAPIRGDGAYRISGRRTGQDYISFTVHAPAADGGYGGAVLADVNDSEIDFAEDGSYEIILSATEQPGNWIRLDPNAALVIVRNYFQHELCAVNDRSIQLDIGIEPLDDLGPSPVINDDDLADRFTRATTMLKAMTVGQRVFGGKAAAPFVSNEPNSVGTPWSFRDSGADTVGAVDIFYSSGSFNLGPDDVLVMEGTIPPSRFTNVMLWNVHMQTLDYSTRQISLNERQIQRRDDGSYRILIGARNPNQASSPNQHNWPSQHNWIDTAGHQRGTIFWRFLLPESDPEQPRCRVINYSELDSLDA